VVRCGSVRHVDLLGLREQRTRECRENATLRNATFDVPLVSKLHAIDRFRNNYVSLLLII
jgi:hypothetical protein